MKLVAAVAALSLLAAPAFAQLSGPGGGMDGMGGMDGGMGGGMPGGGRGGPPGDGPSGGRRAEPKPMKPIAWSKLEAHIRERFAEADLNHDGQITIPEVKAAREARLKTLIDERFAQIDSDRNGAISPAEFAAWQLHIGDPEEADQRMAAQDRQRIAQPEGPEGPGGGGRRRGPGGADELAGFLLAPIDEMMIINADANNDVALSLAEMTAFQKARFDTADLDHDGALSEEELRAARPAQKRRP
jgi:Ca2+-binding EF-hand superfamily protein